MGNVQEKNLERIKEMQKIVDRIEQLLNDYCVPVSDSSIYTHTVEPLITSHGLIGAIKKTW